MERKEIIRGAFEVKSIDDAGRFTGYGAVYGNVDEGGEVIAPGAFADSLTALATKGRKVPMLWQHRSAEPIGIYNTVREDVGGLHVDGQIVLETQRGREAHALMRAQALTGLSVGFVTRDDSYDKVAGVRTIKRADLWEVSPVTFPMNDLARIQSVKGLDGIGDLGDFERYLREVSGVTKSEAKALTNRIFQIARREVAKADGTEQTGEVVAELVRRARALSVA